MGQPQGMELTEKGEDDLLVVTAEHARGLAVQPLRTLQLRALRAKPMATRVVPHPLPMPLGTRLHMAP